MPDSSEKSHIQNPLGLVKNHRTPKTFNKDKKVVRKEYPSTGKGSQNALKIIDHTPPGV
jgi:hypothetical protein